MQLIPERHPWNTAGLKYDLLRATELLRAAGADEEDRWRGNVLLMNVHNSLPRTGVLCRIQRHL
ncbi:MAG TPA: hypothetical protein DIT89_10230 [Planctomycetaceae bacterium]|nr:hypothetical protein [Planctomycetaceae bacterium]